MDADPLVRVDVAIELGIAYKNDESLKENIFARAIRNPRYAQYLESLLSVWLNHLLYLRVKDVWEVGKEIALAREDSRQAELLLKGVIGGGEEVE